MNRKNIVILLAVLGIIVAGYLAYAYYTDTHGLCDINDTFNCTTVHQSDYAVLFGLPVAIIGFIGYLLIILFAVWKFEYVKWISLFGTLFSLRLTWAEFYVIEKFCIFCLISQGLIFLIFLFSVKWKRYLKK
ncbi:MAG: vitamin K epoxide reductase family protein [archaeon]